MRSRFSRRRRFLAAHPAFCGFSVIGAPLVRWGQRTGAEPTVKDALNRAGTAGFLSKR